MKKVGIITYHFAQNYGAVLQCYALQTYLSQQGYAVTVFDFVSEKQQKNNDVVKHGASVKTAVANICLLPFTHSIRKKHARFVDFCQKNLHLTPHFSTVESLEQYIEENGYDVVISGSDQVLNPNINDFEIAFLYPFKTKAKKIAYAASTGNASPDDIQKIQCYLDDFSKISIVEYGFGFTGARKVSVHGDDGLQELYSRIITARILLLCGTFFAMNILSVALHASSAQYVSMNILFLIILGVAFQLTWLFQGKQDMKLIAIINAVSRLFSVLMVFALVHSENHLYLYCICYAITFLLSAALGILLARKKYGLKVRLCKIADAISEIKDGWYLFISQAMSKIFSGIGTTVLGAVATPSIVGIYSAIYKIPYIMVLFFSPISQALYPHISVCFSKSFESGRKTVTTAAKLVIPAFALAGLAIILLRDHLILIAFGKNYLEYSAIIIPLVLWMLFSVINNFIGIQFLVASGNQKLYSRAFTIGSLITVGMNILLGGVLGIYGVSFAAPIGEMSLTILLYFSVKKAKHGGN